MQVYSGLWKERPVVIKCSVEDPVKTDGVPDSVLQQEMSLFDKPARGTSMDEFKEMLHSFLKVLFLCNHTHIRELYCMEQLPVNLLNKKV